MLPKVRPLACAALGAALLLTAFAGCSPDSRGPNTGARGPATQAPAAPVDDRFGDSYDIVLSRVPAAPAEPPALMSDTLFVHVAYRGGCTDHAFTLHYRTARDTTRLWLAHDGNDDHCEARVYRDLQLPVAAEVLESAAPAIVLLNPQGGPPHLLRWNGEG